MKNLRAVTLLALLPACGGGEPQNATVDAGTTVTFDASASIDARVGAPDGAGEPDGTPPPDAAPPDAVAPVDAAATVAVRLDLVPGGIVVPYPSTVKVTVTGLDADGHETSGPFLGGSLAPFTVSLSADDFGDAHGDVFGSFSRDTITVSGGSVDFAYSGSIGPPTACGLNADGTVFTGLTVVPGTSRALHAMAPGLPTADATLNIQQITNFIGTTAAVKVASSGSDGVASFAVNWRDFPLPGPAAPWHVISGATTGIDAPEGIAYDARPGHVGELYVGNGGATGPLRVFSSPSTACPDGDRAPSRLVGMVSSPFGIALDAGGNPTVAARPGGVDAVQTFSRTAPSGAGPIRSISGASTGLAQPMGVAYDAAGNLYVSNHSNNTITVYAPGATGDVAPIRTIHSVSLSGPVGIALDADGRLFVASQIAHTIAVFAAGAGGVAVPVQVISNSQMREPYGLALVTRLGQKDVVVSTAATSTLLVYPQDADGPTVPIFFTRPPHVKAPRFLAIGP